MAGTTARNSADNVHSLGGWRVHYFGEMRGRPEQLWYIVAGIGLFTTLLLVAYNRIVRPGHPGRRT